MSDGKEALCLEIWGKVVNNFRIKFRWGSAKKRVLLKDMGI